LAVCGGLGGCGEARNSSFAPHGHVIRSRPNPRWFEMWRRASRLSFAAAIGSPIFAWVWEYHGDLPSIFNVSSTGDLAVHQFWAALHLLMGMLRQVCFQEPELLGNALPVGLRFGSECLRRKLLERFTLGQMYGCSQGPFKVGCGTMCAVRTALSSTGIWGLMLRPTSIQAWA